MSATLHQLRSRLIGTPLLLEPAKADLIMAVLAERIGVDASTLPGPTQPYRRPAKTVQIDRATGIAVLPIFGSLVHRGGDLEALSGVVSYTALQAALAALIDAPNVMGVLLDVDSGGGEVAGLQELIDYILAVRNEKPIWALANTRAASAAYWLASAAEKVIMAPHAAVGSIGVLVAHQDVSGAMQKRGVVTTFVHAGARKVDGNPYEPLPDEVRASLQRSVDSLYADFVSAVATNRGMDEAVVRKTEAGMFDGETAIAIGLADAIGGIGATLQAMGAEMQAGRQLGALH